MLISFKFNNRMIKKFVSIYIATLLSCSAFTQSYDNNWVFGDSAGLNFSGGEPSFFIQVLIHMNHVPQSQIVMVIYYSIQMERKYGIEIMLLCPMAIAFTSDY